MIYPVMLLAHSSNELLWGLNLFDMVNTFIIHTACDYLLVTETIQCGSVYILPESLNGWYAIETLDLQECCAWHNTHPHESEMQV